MSSNPETWMGRALELAERGRGRVEPNPLVGALVVKDGVVVGEGWHERYGEAHAEVNALARAGEAARGADCYVTLEPCCHHGKTPPCTDALLRAGVARVFAAMEDPFPDVGGRGAEVLRAAGVPVAFGLGAAEARRQNAPYLKLLATGRPYVHAKWAMTLDGKIATSGGDSKWISSEASRGIVHELRGRMDAIIVGIGTALADDPLLTARPAGPRKPLRIVLDRRARLPVESQLVRTARADSTLVAVGEDAPAGNVAALETAGVRVLRIPRGEFASLDIDVLLLELGKRRLTNILVEGGAAVLGEFLRRRAIDEAHVFIAPKLLGGGLPAMTGQGAAAMADAHVLGDYRLLQVGGDIYVHGRLTNGR